MAPKYDIEISYKTGDSFKSYDETRNIGIEWSDLDKAKIALKRIKEHYKWYDDRNNRWIDDNERSSEPEWHKGIEYDFCLKFPLDNGNDVQISAFWCGYFETLYSAKIVISEDPEMEIHFD